MKEKSEIARGMNLIRGEVVHMRPFADLHSRIKGGDEFGASWESEKADRNSAMNFSTKHQKGVYYG